MEEEKQNNSINCYPHHLHFPFPLKALLCLLGYLGLHPRLYACMYVRMYTVLTERPLTATTIHEGVRLQTSATVGTDFRPKTSKKLVLERLSLVNNIPLLNI